MVANNWHLDQVGASRLSALPTKMNPIVAVLDVGLDLEHPDLALWENKREIPDNNLDDDGNGYVDDIYGWDFGRDDNTPSATSRHGTAVAGIIGATGEKNPMVQGISPDVKIMPLKIFGGYSSPVTNAAKAIRYAVDNGAHIINNSWISYAGNTALKEAVDYAEENGVLVVGGAGNNGDDSYRYPAGYPSVISVAATSEQNKLLSNSTWGKWVDFAAPGMKIPTLDLKGGYSTLGATSAASAVTSGAIALLLSKHPELLDEGVVAIRDRLRTSVKQFPDLKDKTFTGGIINAWEASLPVKSAIVSGKLSNAKGKPIIVWDDENNNLKRDDGEKFSVNSGGEYLIELPPGQIHLKASIGSPAQGKLDYRVKIAKESPFRDISRREGTSDLGEVVEDGVVQIDLPFEFLFFEKEVKQVSVMENGFLVVDGGKATDWAGRNYVNNPLGKQPVFDNQKGVIAPFWDDLSATTESDILTWNNKNTQIVQWTNFEKEGFLEDFTFQVAIRKSGKIRFSYEKPDSNFFSSATVGINSISGNDFRQISHNSPFEAKNVIRLNPVAASADFFATSGENYSVDFF